MSVRYWGQKKRGVSSSANYEGLSSGSEMPKRRKIVKHLCLLKAKSDLSDEEEEDMLDHLYTTQYQMSGIVVTTLGRISVENVENYTHVVYLRFQRKEDLSKFYEHPFYLRVIKQHVMPYCHELVNVDFESEIEDDILPIFRKGEEFNHGIEFMLLIAFKENANGGLIEDALGSLAKLTVKFPSLIAQATQGFNFNLSNNEYTHVVVIRFRSFEAYELFMGNSGYKDAMCSTLFGQFKHVDMLNERASSLCNDI